MKRRMLWAIVAVLTLVTLSCSLTGGSPAEEELEVTQPPSASSGETPAPSQESAPAAEVEDTAIRPRDGMVMVNIPAGEFLMGTEQGPALPQEKPEHAVYLDEYWIDQTEVSNAQYRLCVEAGVCGAPGCWNDVNFAGDDQPVAGVSWDDARTYCEWVGARLPTEAEWEMAARGNDGRSYAWGDERWDGTQANMSGDEDGFEDLTAPVGSFPAGASPYGVLDMTGNVREWVADWYDVEYYAHSPAQNPTGPDSGDSKVSRGGSYSEGGHHSRCTDRMPYALDLRQDKAPFTIGFRCATTAPPGEEATSAPASAASPTAPPEEAASADEQAAASTESSGRTEPWTGEEVLKSYREHTVMREGGAEGTIVSDLYAEWDAEASASHIVTKVGDAVVMEEITIGDTRWTRVGPTPWMQETLTPEEQEAWASKMSLAQLWGDAESVEEDLEAALPETVDLVPAQIFPVPIKGAMTPAGKEMVNGVHCKRYTVDTELAYSHDLPGSGMTEYSGHAKGEIWVADQNGIPPVIVRSWMDEVLTSRTGDDEETSSPYWEHDIYDINVPITIEPPE